MIGVIDVGGGFRGVYGTGVLDRCLDDGVHFECCIGISAGSGNMASYMANQRGRNLPFYKDYSFRKEYMGLEVIKSRKELLNLDYVYGTLSNEDGEDPLDYDAMKNYKGEFIVVATDAITGRPHYFTKKDMSRNNYSVLMASSTLPVFCKGREIGGRVYYDGGLSDCIPVEKAFKEGCDKVVVILTRPLDYELKLTKEIPGGLYLGRKYPELKKTMFNRAKVYNEEIEICKRLALQNKVLIVAPADCCGIDTLTKDREKIVQFYNKGYADGAKIKEFIES